jgi:hypothetical protein
MVERSKHDGKKVAVLHVGEGLPVDPSNVNNNDM